MVERVKKVNFENTWKKIKERGNYEDRNKLFDEDLYQVARNVFYFIQNEGEFSNYQKFYNFLKKELNITMKENK